MHLDDNIDWTLLGRYFAGELSPHDAAAVERWAAADPARRDELEAARRIWSDSGALPTPARVDAMWRSLIARMRTTSSPDLGATPPPPAPPRVRPTGAPVLAIVPLSRAAPRWPRVATAAAAVALLAVGVARHFGLGPTGERVASPPPAPREFATGRGQRATIRLADGSRVELGYASVLRIRQFGVERRELVLEGEAVFDVTHDERRPFVVHAAHATTQDVGTVFGVRAYPGDSTVRVIVVSGAVAVRPRGTGSDAAPGAVLQPRQLGRLDASGRLHVVSGIDTSAYLAWIAGRVSFANAPLFEIAAELERRFGVSIRIPDSAVAARRVTVDMSARSLADVLDAVIVPIHVRSRRSGDTIVLER